MDPELPKEIGTLIFCAGLSLPLSLLIVLVYVARETSRLGKTPISGPPRTLDEFRAYEYRSRIEQHKRAIPYFAFAFVIVPALLCVAAVLFLLITN